MVPRPLLEMHYFLGNGNPARSAVFFFFLVLFPVPDLFSILLDGFDTLFMCILFCCCFVRGHQRIAGAEIYIDDLPDSQRIITGDQPLQGGDILQDAPPSYSPTGWV